MADSKYAPSQEEETSSFPTNGNTQEASSEEQSLPPNPFLTKPVLHIIGLDPVCSDADIAQPFKDNNTTPIK